MSASGLLPSTEDIKTSAAPGLLLHHIDDLQQTSNLQYQTVLPPNIFSPSPDITPASTDLPMELLDKPAGPSTRPPAFSTSVTTTGSAAHHAGAHPPIKTSTGIVEHLEGTDDWSMPAQVLDHPFFVPIGSGSMVQALRELDRRMKESGQYHLITKKPKRTFVGRTVEPGQIGLFDFNGRPIIALDPGRYLNLSLTHSWHGICGVTDQLEFRGLTFAQVGQGECLVVLSPSNQIFCVRNGGFAAFGSEGRFRIVAVVDTLDLGDENAVREPATKEIIGWKKEIRTRIQAGGSGYGVEATVATFFNVPANNVLIVQQGDRLIELPAGQHVITNPNTTFRGFFSLSERQKTFETKPAYTVEGVPVILRVNLRFRIASPILLARHYNDAFMALENPAQSAVNAVVSRLSYQAFMKAKKLEGDIPDQGVVPWLETFKQECMADLTEQASQYGVVIESFNVLDRRLEGDLGKDLERQAEAVLQNQIRATQIDLENHIKLETQRGQLRVAEIEAAKVRTQTDAQFYTRSKETDARAYEKLQIAKATAEASKLQADQDAANTVVLAEAERQRVELLAQAKRREIEQVTAAYAEMQGEHTPAIVMAQLEVDKHRALPPQTVYFAGGSSAAGASSSAAALSTGYATALGATMAVKGNK
ncbi:hypothetical protein AMAG_18858 [Allomyces macrogynus ATCC 38327]|uniref:Band 7 domain-containing protein n=1 Tax=Allomyces macrogynus (strain ATCC 38327) TaxID=578462 RepID=A0A0L0SIU9_ALLM3|nr:hypothetical protein AMAG_18858 [Allomyces macrogynus ATCC 38327]|eukprot:KNE62369.1 hypothetical protein AMAG_18858 [Allomyces macrogynus ATCC 38327]